MFNEQLGLWGLIVNNQSAKNGLLGFSFNDFWKNMSWDFKRICVCSTVEIKETKQKTAGNNHSKRNSSYFYYLKVHDKRVPVCQLMYL